MTGYLYILRSLKNRSYYVGSTNNIARRVLEHKNGEEKYTSKILPVKLVFCKEYATLALARKVEKSIKSKKSKKIIDLIVTNQQITIQAN